VDCCSSLASLYVRPVRSRIGFGSAGFFSLRSASLSFSKMRASFSAHSCCLRWDSRILSRIACCLLAHCWSTDVGLAAAMAAPLAEPLTAPSPTAMYVVEADGDLDGIPPPPLAEALGVSGDEELELGGGASSIEVASGLASWRGDGVDEDDDDDDAAAGAGAAAAGGGASGVLGSEVKGGVGAMVVGGEMLSGALLRRERLDEEGSRCLRCLDEEEEVEVVELMVALGSSDEARSSASLGDELWAWLEEDDGRCFLVLLLRSWR